MTLEERVEQLEKRLAELEKTKDRLALSPDEAANMTGLSKSTIYAAAYNNDIPYRRVNARGKKGQGRIIIPLEPLIKWLNGDDSQCPGKQISTAPGKPGRKKTKAL